MSLRPLRRSRWTALLLVPAAFALVSCGSDSDSGPLTGKEVAAAFKEAADGYSFKESTTLVEGATAYAPAGDVDQPALESLNYALGEGSVLWQVLVFEGPDAPEGVAAAKAAAFASDSFDEVAAGVFIGDSEIAYVPHENVVVTGPVLEGDPEDPTLLAWKEVVDGL